MMRFFFLTPATSTHTHTHTTKNKRVYATHKTRYTWEGKMEVSEELILKIKTRRSLVPQLSTAIGSLHPYDVPEVIAVPVVGGGQSYLSWVEENTISAT